jgi:hypothetical protein
MSKIKFFNDKEEVNNLTTKLSNNDYSNNNLKTTETDLMVEQLAASSKLIPEDERKYFEKSKNIELDDNIDDIIGNNKIDNKDIENIKKTDHIKHFTSDNDLHKTYKDNTVQTEESVKTDIKKDEKEEKIMTAEELMLEKLNMLRKLGELVDAGITLTQNYNINSDLKMMKYEYELHKSIRAKKNSINWMSSMTLNCIYGIEMLNDKYDPFDLKLKGWSEQMNSDIGNYYDVFGELYEKYSHPTKGMAPELKFLLMVSGSALKFHLSNHVINSLPNLNTSLENNPELIEKLRNRAVSDKVKENTIRQNNDLNKKMEEEHVNARKNVDDLKMIKEKEMEFLNMKKELANKQNKINQLKQSLSTNYQPRVIPHNMNSQPQLVRPTINPELNNILNNNENEIYDRLNMPNIRSYNQTNQNRNQWSNVHEQNINNLSVSRLQHELNKESNRKQYLDNIINDNESIKSSVSINENINNIFKQKKNKTKIVDSDKNNKIKSIDTVERDDVSYISLGSKKSKKKNNKL